MLDFLRKFFQAEGAESGNTGNEEDEKDLLLEDDHADNTDDQKNNQNNDQAGKTDDDETDYELSTGDDLPIEEYEKNIEKIKKKIAGDKIEAEQTDKESDEDKTKDADDLLFDPGKSADDKGTGGKTPKLVTITDEYIASQPEDHQDILRSIKGTAADPKVIKNYIHKELLIRELKGNGQAAETKADQSAGDKNNFNEVEISKHKSSYMYRNLKQDYPDLTEEVFADEDSLEEFLADLQSHSPLKARKFEQKYLELDGKWGTRTKQMQDYAQNWERITKAQAVEAVKSFNDHISKRGLNSNDLGIKYTESWLMDNIIAPGGKPDPEIVSYMDSQGTIPVINEKMLLAKLKDKYNDSILDAIENKASKDALLNRARREADPSISIGNVRRRAEQPLPLEKAITPDMPLDEMEKILEEQKKQLLKADGTPY